MSPGRAIRKVGLLGTFGYGNLGDAAIQDAMIQNVRRRFPAAEIIGFSLNPEDTEQRHGIRSYPITRMSWQDSGDKQSWSQRLAAWLGNRPEPLLRQLARWLVRLPLEFGLLVDAHRNLAGLDQLIISGGGQLDDYWAGGGPWSHPYTLLKFGLLARLRSIQYMIVSVGAGPVDARLSQLFIRWALQLAEYRSYRDEYSRAYVATVIGFKGHDPVYPDLAFSLAAEESCLEAAPRARPTIGIGPVGYFRAGCWPEADETVYAAYLAKLADFVCWLLDRQYAVVFLPGEVKYDSIVIGELQRLVEAKRAVLPAGALVAPDIQTVADLQHELSTLDLVCASRFHTLLLSQISGKPGLALSYQSKIDSLMKNTGQEKYCLPIASFELQVLQNAFLDLEANLAASRQQINDCAHQNRNELEQQYARIFNDA